MTIDEALVCQKHRYPVRVRKSYSTEHLVDKNYKVCELHKCMSVYTNTYIQSVTLQDNGRSVRQLDIDYVYVAPEYIEIVAGQVKKLQKQRFKKCLENLLSEGKNKTEINKIVKSLVDEIKESKK